MTKRFIESDEIFENWHQELSLEYSYLWLILNLHCNKGGVITINVRYLSYLSKFEVDKDELKKNYSGRITSVNDDKIFINDFFSKQNGYNLNLANDAIKGGLKTLFNDTNISEDHLRKLGYSFYIGGKGKKPMKIHNVAEFITQYARVPRDYGEIEDCFIQPTQTSESQDRSSNKGTGQPMGTPRSSRSNSRGNSNSNSNGSNEKWSIEEIERNIDSMEFTFDYYQDTLSSLPKLSAIKKQLTSGEFELLKKCNDIKPTNKLRFWKAVGELEQEKQPIFEDSVYQSLESILQLPF